MGYNWLIRRNKVAMDAVCLRRRPACGASRWPSGNEKVHLLARWRVPLNAGTFHGDEYWAGDAAEEEAISTINTTPLSM